MRPGGGVARAPSHHATHTMLRTIPQAQIVPCMLSYGSNSNAAAEAGKV